MTKLTDAQLVILSAACDRPDRRVLPLPKSLKGGAANKVISALIGRGLIEEIEADVTKGDPVWRKPDDGPAKTLVATDAACALLDGGNEAPQEGTQRPTRPKDEKGGAKSKARPKGARKAPQGPTPREGTKQAELIAMLRRAKGATIAEMTEALGWQAHTVRGALAGALKKRLGLNVVSEVSEKRGRVYRIEE
jgi:hypothetical protein